MVDKLHEITTPTSDPDRSTVGETMTVEDVSISMKRKLEDVSDEVASKQPKLETTEATDNAQESLNESKLAKKELMKIEKQRQRALEKEEKAQKREQERKRKEEEKLRKQQEREQEKQLKRKKMEEEKAAKELKKEQEKQERERKKEEERLRKQQEKDAREQSRLEKKRRLEEEKEQKEQEKRALEEEKRKKEELKRRKEEEEAKSQKKISSFFTVKKLAPAIPKADPTLESVENGATDFEKDFLPFFVQNNMEVASMGQLNSNELSKSKKQLDDIFLEKKYDGTPEVYWFFASKAVEAIHTESTITPDDIVNALNSSTTTETQIYDMINKFPPLKFISFYENSKPPYIGTWCSVLHQQIKFDPKNPLDTTLTGFDYDYDSDLEWNKEDEEGEDIDNEDEDDEEDILADEDDLGFVEDDKPNDQTKKFHSLNVMIKINDGSQDDFFNSMKTIALTELPLPIDPFKTATKPNTPEPVKTSEQGKTSKPIIDDTNTIYQLIKFFDSSDFSSFSLNTILELAMKHIEFSNKSLMRNTLHHILKKERLTLTWSIKENARKEYTPS